MKAAALALAVLLPTCPAGGERAAPVPEGFVPVSVWFETRRLGWALGPGEGGMAAVVATEDGGRTWSPRGTLAVPATDTPGMEAVDRLRVAYGAVWAFGSATVVSDGGSWRHSTPGSREVVSVAAPGEGTLRLVGLRGEGGLREAEVWFAIGDGDERLDRAPVAALDDLEVRGGWYYRTTGGSFRVSTDGGRTWATRTACHDDLVDVVGVAPRRAYFLCQGSVGFSADAGATVTTVSGRGSARIAANDRGTVVLAGPELEVSHDGGRTFRTVAPGGPWREARFVDAWFATAVGPDGLWVTTDGGRTWTPMPVA